MVLKALTDQCRQGDVLRDRRPRDVAPEIAKTVAAAGMRIGPSEASIPFAKKTNNSACNPLGAEGHIVRFE
jgi:hypothetical protein